jgi:hypothetical protein
LSAGCSKTEDTKSDDTAVEKSIPRVPQRPGGGK